MFEPHSTTSNNIQFLRFLLIKRAVGGEEPFLKKTIRYIVIVYATSLKGGSRIHEFLLFRRPYSRTFLKCVSFRSLSQKEERITARVQETQMSCIVSENPSYHKRRYMLYFCNLLSTILRVKTNIDVFMKFAIAKRAPSDIDIAFFVDRSFLNTAENPETRRSFPPSFIMIGDSDINTELVPVNSHPNLDLNRLEKSWAKSYHDKPKEERERLINELHGVASRAVPESPQMIASALASFKEMIDGCCIPDSEKLAYYRACRMNSTYVQSAPFRLKFLRAELFHVKRAALRYVCHLNYLLEEFGEYALMRQLWLSDLNAKEIKFLRKGYLQILPFRDSVGRRIIVSLGSFGGREFSMKTRERVSAYLNFAVLADDETSQRKGVVSVGMLNEDATVWFQSVDVEHFNRFMQLVPIRYTGIHACLNDTLRSRIIKALTYACLRGEVRLMSRIHIGKHKWHLSK